MEENEMDEDVLELEEEDSNEEMERIDEEDDLINNEYFVTMNDYGN